MAEVFLARYAGPEGFEKQLVIKRVLARISASPHLLRMFFEEAKTQVSFSQGNLVSVFDFGRVDNEYFIAMDYVRGADLASLFAAERAAGRSARAVAPGVPGRRDLPWPRVCARPGLRSSRRDAAERARVGGRRGEAVGLRSGAGGAEPDRAGASGHAQLHGARAGARRSRRRARGHLLARPDSGGGIARAGPARRSRRGRAASTPLSSPTSPRHGALGAIVARAVDPSPGQRLAGAEEMLAALEAEIGRVGRRPGSAGARARREGSPAGARTRERFPPRRHEA